MAQKAIQAGKKVTARELFALVFGLFLGLAILKFGNPVILDNKVDPPESLSDFWHFAWPPHWAGYFLLPLAVCAGVLALAKPVRWPSRWLWLLPLIWLGWQFLAATQSVDGALTGATLWQFSGCVASYFIGACLLGDKRALHWLLVGVLAGFAFCLVRGIDQRLFEFPAERQLLIEGQNSGWTNETPEAILEMKHEQIIVTTNGMDVANPLVLQKFARGRVSGTMVYPNALAGMILLLLPVSLFLVFSSSRGLKPPIRLAAIALVVFLGGAAFFFTGSKLGWLIGMAAGGMYLFCLNWSQRLKWGALIALVVVGLGVFAVRFHNYFAAGATSVGARFDYWRAAVQTTSSHPLFGTGPGTFQRPYAQIKSPAAEMARLTHNDFLEQFSDSGLPGGLAYTAWVLMALAVVGRHFWRREDALRFACFVGVIGWFAQALGEFGLYIPVSAWATFTLLGALIAPIMNQFDKKTGSS